MLSTFGDRTFSVAAPKLWNALPAELRSISSLSAFKSSLKTHLFKLALIFRIFLWFISFIVSLKLFIGSSI